MRNVLLIEPNYKNKYPPIGLMKLATYHRNLGDNVIFYKGDLNDFIINQAVQFCIIKFSNIDNSINWQIKYNEIRQYIKTRNKSLIENIGIKNSKFEFLLLNALSFYKDYYWKKEYSNNPLWDRICISTLFTFHWKITIETIEFCKNLIKNNNEIWIGGTMASVIPDEIYKATKINNIFVGLLDKPGILDKNKLIIDELSLDYSILYETEYKYPESNAYYGYMTRGCIRKCAFCAVPVIEPKFKKYISISDKINEVKLKYGEQRNLLLLDNNVLATKENFSEIINDIKKSGFKINSLYVEPNLLDISIKNLKKGYNNRAYIKRCVELFNELLEGLKEKDKKQFVYNQLKENNLLFYETATKDTVLKVYKELSGLFEKYRNKASKHRYVDFNQGVDARLFNEKNVKLISQIPIKPLRIAFDNMAFEKDYLKAIKLSVKYGIKDFSNYLLYNFDEKPIELYQRLKINVELCEEFKINIYSFPMKYHPVFGDYNLNRDFLGKYWNRKFIRAVQVILNATKGKIGKGQSFFYKAFGEDEKEYLKILYMPETYILFRFFFEEQGLTEEWKNLFDSLHGKELQEAKNIIEKNNFKNIKSLTINPQIHKLLKHYTITREKISDPSSKLFKQKSKFDILTPKEKVFQFV